MVLIKPCSVLPNRLIWLETGSLHGVWQWDRFSLDQRQYLKYQAKCWLKTLNYCSFLCTTHQFFYLRFSFSSFLFISWSMRCLSTEWLAVTFIFMSSSCWYLLWAHTVTREMRWTWPWQNQRLSYFTRRSRKRLTIMRISSGFWLQGAKHKSMQLWITTKMNLEMILTR